MDGDYVSGLLVGTAGLDFGVPGLNASFSETLCGAGSAGAAGLAAMFGDGAAGMHGFGNGGQFGPAEGAAGSSPPRPGRAPPSPTRRGRTAQMPRSGRHLPWAPPRARRPRPPSPRFYLKVTPEFGLQMGEATGPNSKKCKIEDETVRPKVEEEAATASDGSAGGERGPKQAKGKGSKSKQPAADEPPRDYVHVRARRGQATDSHSLAERWFLPIEGGYLEPEGFKKGQCTRRAMGLGGHLEPGIKYMQIFDPGFGFNGGAYTIQPLYAPAVTYNTEFRQLGSPQMSHVPVEQQQPHPMA
ncbi:Transcription factor bHLH49 [Hordeum vulgare]|nr:Transcription factor bHLH49 [Hordeum vulgare]